MRYARTTSSELARLQRTLATAWTAAWILGIGVLAWVSINLSGALHRQDTDAQLMLTAVATYGLTWIDTDGQFHDEVFRRDIELSETPFDIWVIRPGPPVETLLRPDPPHFEIPTLTSLAANVVSTEEAVTQSGSDKNGTAYRFHAIPTYQDERDEVAVAAVIVVGNPEAGEAAHRAFVQKLLVLAVALGALGIGVGVALARWSLKPVAGALLERERFVRAAAHELRTPVASLRAVCDSGLAGDEPADAALSRMSSVVRRTDALVNQLLLYARLDAGTRKLEIEPLRLDLLVEAAIPDDGSVILEAEECVVQADPHLLETAVSNLVRNACLHGQSDDEENQERVDGSGGPKAVRVRVTPGQVVVEDSGPGFPQEVFASLHASTSMLPSTKGIGLGLSVVRMIVDLHGGHLSLENLPGGGARAVLRLNEPGVS